MFLDNRIEKGETLNAFELALIISSLDRIKRARFITKAAARMIVYSALVPKDVLALRWDHVDIEGGMILAGSGASIRVVPLPKQAHDVIRRTRAQSFHEGFVFAHNQHPEKAISEAAVARLLARVGFNLPLDQLHFLIAQTLYHMSPAQCDVSIHLGFETAQEALRWGYRDSLEWRRKMLQKWADYLDTLILASSIEV